MKKILNFGPQIHLLSNEVEMACFTYLQSSRMSHFINYSSNAKTWRSIGEGNYHFEVEISIILLLQIIATNQMNKLLIPRLPLRYLDPLAV